MDSIKTSLWIYIPLSETSFSVSQVRHGAVTDKYSASGHRPKINPEMRQQLWMICTHAQPLVAYNVMKLDLGVLWEGRPLPWSPAYVALLTGSTAIHHNSVPKTNEEFLQHLLIMDDSFEGGSRSSLISTAKNLVFYFHSLNDPWIVLNQPLSCPKTPDAAQKYPMPAPAVLKSVTFVALYRHAATSRCFRQLYSQERQAEGDFQQIWEDTAAASVDDSNRPVH